MANLTVTSAQVAVVFPTKAETFNAICVSTVTAGQPVYQTSAGKVAPADGNGSGTVQFRGIALENGGAEQAISVLKEGHCYGFDLSGLNYDELVYLSNDVGRVCDDTPGSTTVNIGRVMPLSDADLTKTLYVSARWTGTWS
jgi:hypothetical protein